MKKYIVLYFFLLLITEAYSQVPEKMSYQAVIRNASNSLLPNQTVGIQISIIQGTLSGMSVYSETHTTTTNSNGLVSIEIGSGIPVTGNFSSIDWANDSYFIKSETDPLGGTNYNIIGTSQLLSVPYALHSKTTEIAPGITIETDPVFAISAASGITSNDITSWNNKLDSEMDSSITNEIQVIDIRNDTLFLSLGGGFAKLPIGFDGQYSSLTGSPTNISSFTNDVGYINSEVDGSTTNELQVISRTGTTVTLSNGGGSYQDSVNVYSSGTGVNITNNVISVVTPTYSTGLNTSLGGYVFYVTPNGKHGLVAALQDQSTSVNWYEANDVCNNPALHDINGREFTDWRLPTKRELNMLYVNRASIGGFANAVYWSSTAYTDVYAWAQNFNLGNQFSSGLSNAPQRIRCVRSF